MEPKFDPAPRVTYRLEREARARGSLVALVKEKLRKRAQLAMELADLDRELGALRTALFKAIPEVESTDESRGVDGEQARRNPPPLSVVDMDRLAEHASQSCEETLGRAEESGALPRADNNGVAGSEPADSQTKLSGGAA